MMKCSCYLDINECLGTNYCEHTCHNTLGSYGCSCMTGYQLDTDQYQCKGIASTNNSLAVANYIEMQC